MSSLRSSVVLGALVLLASAAVYPWLPAEVPIHFDFRGRVDATAPKAIGAFVLPIVALSLVAAVTMLARRRPVAERGPLAAMALLTTALFAGLHLIVLRAALLGVTDVGLAIGALLAVASLAMGLLMPRVRRNAMVGIRTPWSLASDEAWARSHRLGGYLFVGAGVIGVSGVVAGRPEVPILAMVAAALGAGAGSWLVSRS